MCEDALCRLYKGGLPYDWQNKYDTSEEIYTTVAALVPFLERIKHGERRLHRAGGQNRHGSYHSNSRNTGPRNSNNNRRSSNNNNRQQQQRGEHRGCGQGNNNGSNQINTAATAQAAT
ncbi:hypothetical protein ON010_g4735 [Phytophthora cinnamomi]|nr:hypothetical protein ON010_g4735 [Phytophthora cinnamomi]